MRRGVPSSAQLQRRVGAAELADGNSRAPRAVWRVVRCAEFFLRNRSVRPSE